MEFKLPPRIAWRYLTSKKKRGATGVLSAAALCGVMITVAAIICVLSVFNGFQKVLSENVSSLMPDVSVTPQTGKVIHHADSLIDAIRSNSDDIVSIYPVIEDNALLIHNGMEMPVTLKGVDSAVYARTSGIGRYIIEGEFHVGKKTSRHTDATAENQPAADEGFSEEKLLEEEEPDNSENMVTISIGTAARTRAMPGDRELILFTPSRTKTINPANPVNSFEMETATVSGIFQTKQEKYDRDMVITDLETARHLFEYTDEVSAIEIRLHDPDNSGIYSENLQKTLGQRYVVKDKLRQQEVNFRMISIEKWVTFLLLAFILVIAFFNVISALSILVIDKENDTRTLQILGLTGHGAGWIFAWEGIYVSLFGGISGVILGSILCLLQQEFGIIRLNGNSENLLVTSYPVELQPLDIGYTLVLVAVIGGVAAAVAGAFVRRRLQMSDH